MKNLSISPILTLCFLLFGFIQPATAQTFEAGAAIVDVTPRKFPVIVNGGFTGRQTDKVTTPLKARGLAFSYGKTKLVIVTVDSCMMPRPLLDEVKTVAAKKTGLRTDHILISATHTHTAVSCMGALGTPSDPVYPHYLKVKLVETIEASLKALQPAKVGYAKINAAEYTALRRWIRRPDRIANDPFGNPTVRAHMHAGKNWEDVTGESGPEDPDLSMISVQTAQGKPLAVMANFSMHYFAGERGLSADYFGLFSDGLKQKLSPCGDFVGIMTHGCSGDIWRRDYTKPESWDPKLKIQDYANAMIDLAVEALETVEYSVPRNLSMAENRMTLNYRVPDQQRLQWAQKIVDGMDGRLPKTKEEVYANEQIILHERKQAEVVTQAARIGDIGIATTPNETYAITGLKIKAASPLKHTMVIELANGGDGYIPPPEQHLFGGYNTWPARSAGLEVLAEPKITESCIHLLETVAGKARERPEQSRGAGATNIAGLKPFAWYRLDEFAGPRAVDSTGQNRDGIYESHVTYYLEGPDSKTFCASGETNRAAMFAGGRLRTYHPDLQKDWSVSLWFWNGMPNDAREVSGWLLSRGRDYGTGANSLHLGIGGTNGNTGQLILQQGSNSKVLQSGQSITPRWQWQHLALVKKNQTIEVYLNGKKEMTASGITLADFDHLFFGGRSDNQFNWEGRLDEIAIFDRALPSSDIRTLAQSLSSQ